MKRLAKPLAAILLFGILAPSAVPIFAEDEPITDYTFTNGQYNQVKNVTIDGSELAETQGGRYVTDQGFNGSSMNAAGSLAQAGGTCVFGSMLSQLLSSFISYLLEALVSDVAEEATLGLLRVPIQTDLGTSGAQKAQRAKDVCAWAPFGFCVLPSLDSIAFCFVNQIIEYISKATVQWIKTGFQGSPAFIDDPEKFFTNAVDSVAGNILNQISDGLLCEPWRAQIQVQLLNEHTGSFQSSAGGCRLSEISDKWENFANGEAGAFDWDLQFAYSQNPYNNPVGSLIEARNAFNIQLANTQNGLQVQAGWSNGFLQVKDPETGRITTPGRVIENQLNNRLNHPYERLLIADEFDEIINTLVNQLIKMALSEVFDGEGESVSPDGQLRAEIEYERRNRDAGGGESAGGGEEAPPENLDPDGGTDGIGADLDGSCVLSASAVNEGGAVTATVTATGYSGTVTFAWVGEAGLADTFTQSTNGNVSVASATFNDEGRYDIEVRLGDGDWDGETETIDCPTLAVNEDYALSCTVSDSTIRPGERVTYTAVVAGADGAITDRRWGGATSGLGESISKTYGSVGTYDVHVEVADEEGNRRRADCPAVSVAR